MIEPELDVEETHAEYVPNAKPLKVPNRPIVVKNAKKKDDSPLLFPGWLLAERCRNTQHGACVVGSTAERICESTFGGKLQPNARDENCQLFPDLYYERSETMMEVKACKKGGRFLLELGQLERYTSHGGCVYGMVCYQHDAPVRKKGSIGEIVENVASTVSEVYVLDVAVMAAIGNLRFQVPKGITLPDGVAFRLNVKLYFYGRDVLIRDYVTLRPRTLQDLKENPTEFLTKIGLHPEEFSLKTYRRRVRFRYNDVEFKTKTFTVHGLRETLPF